MKLDLYPCQHCQGYHFKGNMQFCLSSQSYPHKCQYCARMYGRKCKRHAT